MATTSDYLSTTLLGVLAGMRSMTPPTLVSLYLNRNQQLRNGALTNVLGSGNSLTAFTLLALGEITADKFPQAPNRTFAPAVFGRLGTSALSSAAVAEAHGENRTVAAALSAAVTGVATFATFQARMAANQYLPNPVTGVIEDGILLSIGASLLRRWHRSTKAEHGESTSS
jgi:uncharacterized membrane protein